MDNIVTVTDVSKDDIMVSCSGTKCEGCHSGMFCKNKGSSFNVTNPENLDIHKGDVVMLDIPAKSSIIASFMTLGVPLICFFAGMVIAYLCGQAEYMQFVFAIAGLAVGFLISYVFFRIHKLRYTPSIKEKVDNE